MAILVDPADSEGRDWEFVVNGQPLVRNLHFGSLALFGVARAGRKENFESNGNFELSMSQSQRVASSPNFRGPLCSSDIDQPIGYLLVFKEYFHLRSIFRTGASLKRVSLLYFR